MKKSMIIVCGVLTALSLTAYGYINWHKAPVNAAIAAQPAADNPYFALPVLQQPTSDLLLNVGSRFIHTITKAQLKQAKTIGDLLPAKATNKVVAYESVRISLLENGQESGKSASGDSQVLTPAQMQLLHSADYSTDLFIRADYDRSLISSISAAGFLTYYFTIVPEQEARYPGGAEAITAYLSANSREQTAHIEQDELEPGKIAFTVSPQGNITHVRLLSTCGYSGLDNALLKLIHKLHGKWEPASNAKGEKISQELVLFFGNEGC